MQMNAPRTLYTNAHQVFRTASFGQFIIGLLQTWRQRSASGSTCQMRVQETVVLDPKRRLHLIECDGRRVVLMTGGTQDVVVGWLPPT